MKPSGSGDFPVWKEKRVVLTSSSVGSWVSQSFIRGETSFGKIIGKEGREVVGELNRFLKQSMLLDSSWGLVIFIFLDPSLFRTFRVEFLDLLIFVAMLKNLVFGSPRFSH